MIVSLFTDQNELGMSISNVTGERENVSGRTTETS